MPRLRHLYIEGYPYFVTAATGGRKVFSDAQSANILLSCIYHARKVGWYLLLSFVIMPEHLHMIIVPRTKNISQIMKSIKGYSARLINLNIRNRGSIWQDGFYDYILDTQGKLLTKLEYIQNNPVKEGLTKEPELYFYSSAYRPDSTDLNVYLNNSAAGQECPAYPVSK
ncbi:MAG: hypothetical protein A2216_02955 [Omnitrophica WOR_2 bacterium RIFOXYA2_FULL_45_12]|nr:MAG: hypothetical protein A2216_02955 [Omnitrophica WOR_2 bacterium RIFOXYA2_FULL_45_12]